MKLKIAEPQMKESEEGERALYLSLNWIKDLAGIICSNVCRVNTAQKPLSLSKSFNTETEQSAFSSAEHNLYGMSGFLLMLP